MNPTNTTTATMLEVLGLVAAPVLVQLLRRCHDITVGWRDAVAVTVITVAVLMAVCVRWAGDPALVAWWWLALTGLALTVIDTAQHRLPHPWVLAMACGGLGGFTLASANSGRWWPLGRACTAGVVVLAVGIVLHVVLAGHLGGGDVTLTAALAVFLGWLSWQAVLFGVLAGVVVLGLCAGWVWLSTGHRSCRIPAGPSLIAGTWISLLILSPA
jgi:leader peptidase (prepilin peptidase) / N-methyltransferase